MSETVEQIRAGLEHEPAVNLHADQVDVVEGDAIRLVGRVSNIEAKRKALRVARERGETPRIQDELRVFPAGEQPPGDGELEDSVERNLGGDQDFAGIPVPRGRTMPQYEQGYGIRVQATAGVVLLEGRVPSINHRRLAEVLCWWTPGATDVDNRVEVDPPEEDHDGEITEVLRLILERDPGLNANEITPEVRNAEVTLTGRIAHRGQGDRAERNCWYVPGVHEVHNHLAVFPG